MDKNIYEGPKVAGKVEANRLDIQAYYADPASHEMLGEQLDGETILDVGGGTNSTLEKWAKERGAESFTVLDVNPLFLRKRKAEGSERLVRGNVRVSLPFADESCSVVHERNVLPHIPLDQREGVVQEMIRVAERRVLFLEYDWGSFKGKKGSAIELFKLFMLKEMFPKMYVQPFLNNELKQLISSSIPTGLSIQREYRHRRDRGDYYDEIFGMIKSLKQLISRMNDNKGLEEALRAVIHALYQEKKSGGLKPFVPADIVGVEVRK